MTFYGTQHAKQERKRQEEVLNHFRTKLGLQFGITMTEDTFGEHGQMGTLYVTLRDSMGDDEMVQISMTVQSVTRTDRV
jgi:hypothetical protein